MSARDKDRKAREKDARKAGKKDQPRNPAHSPGRGGRAPRKCTTCGGKGSVTRWYKDRRGISRKLEDTCGTCGGRGETT